MIELTFKNKLIKSLLVIFDAEGSTEIVSWQELAIEYRYERPTPLLKKSLSDDLNALFRGAKKAGVENIYLLDGHSVGNNIALADLDSNGLNIFLQNETLENLESFAKKSDCAAIIAAHGKYGSQDGVPPLLRDEFEKKLKTGLGHVFLFTIKNLYLNGISVGESIFLTNLFKDLDLPVIFFTGSKAAIDEVNKFFKEVRTVATKDGKKKYDFNTVRKKIEEEIYDAVLNAQLGKGFVSLTDPRFNYKSTMIEFKKSTNPHYKNIIEEDINYFRRLKGEFDLAISNKKVTILPKNLSKPYLEIYRILDKVMNESFGE